MNVTNVNQPVEFVQDTYSFNLLEGVSRVIVGTVRANDPDGTAVTYSLVSPPAGWTIHRTTGVITYAGNPYDNAITASVSLVARADSGGDFDTAAVTVNIVNVIQVSFTQDDYAYTLLDNADGRTTPVVIGTPTISNPDGAAVTYGLTGNNNFQISSAGQITYHGNRLDAGTPPAAFNMIASVSYTDHLNVLAC